jgi:hypothetical protein
LVHKNAFIDPLNVTMIYGDDEIFFLKFKYFYLDIEEVIEIQVSILVVTSKKQSCFELLKTFSLFKNPCLTLAIIIRSTIGAIYWLPLVVILALHWDSRVFQYF